METQEGDGIKLSVSNPDSDIIPEPDTNMDTSDITGTQQQQIYQQHWESKWRYREGIKRSH